MIRYIHCLELRSLNLESNDEQKMDKDISALGSLFTIMPRGGQDVAGLFFSLDQAGTLFN